MNQKIILPMLVGIVAVTVFMMLKQGGVKKPTSVHVNMPSLSNAANEGRELFKANCSQCHREDAGGTEQGPPLIHKYYEPNHHADITFYRAATHGVIAHHWNFGNMPPIRTVTKDDVTKIIAYIREVQKANGIF